MKYLYLTILMAFSFIVVNVAFDYLEIIITKLINKIKSRKAGQKEVKK